MTWYLEALKKYAVFSGRARRKEYWMFFLFNIIICLILGIIEGVMDIAPGRSRSVFGDLYMLAVLIPNLAVGVRRLHDTGRSGWWLLINFVPIIGAIIMLVFTIQDSEPGENQYGSNQKDGPNQKEQ